MAKQNPKSSEEIFFDRQNSAEGDEPVKVTNPAKSREEAIKYLGLESDPAKDGVDEAIEKLDNE
jgi:hypothetical protein